MQKILLWTRMRAHNNLQISSVMGVARCTLTKNFSPFLSLEAIPCTFASPSDAEPPLTNHGYVTCKWTFEGKIYSQNMLTLFSTLCNRRRTDGCII